MNFLSGGKQLSRADRWKDGRREPSNWGPENPTSKTDGKIWMAEKWTDPAPAGRDCLNLRGWGGQKKMEEDEGVSTENIGPAWETKKYKRKYEGPKKNMINQK